MFDGEYSNYWTSTETYESLKNYISMNFDELKDADIVAQKIDNKLPKDAQEIK